MGLHKRTAFARLPLRQLGFLVHVLRVNRSLRYWRRPSASQPGCQPVTIDRVLCQCCSIVSSERHCLRRPQHPLVDLL